MSLFIMPQMHGDEGLDAKGFRYRVLPTEITPTIGTSSRKLISVSSPGGRPSKRHKSHSKTKGSSLDSCRSHHSSPDCPTPSCLELEGGLGSLSEVRVRLAVHPDRGSSMSPAEFKTQGSAGDENLDSGHDVLGSSSATTGSTPWTTNSSAEPTGQKSFTIAAANSSRPSNKQLPSWGRPCEDSELVDESFLDVDTRPSSVCKSTLDDDWSAHASDHREGCFPSDNSDAADEALSTSASSGPALSVMKQSIPIDDRRSSFESDRSLVSTNAVSVLNLPSAVQDAPNNGVFSQSTYRDRNSSQDEDTHDTASVCAESLVADSIVDPFFQDDCFNLNGNAVPACLQNFDKRYQEHSFAHSTTTCLSSLCTRESLPRLNSTIASPLTSTSPSPDPSQSWSQQQSSGSSSWAGCQLPAARCSSVLFVGGEKASPQTNPEALVQQSSALMNSDRHTPIAWRSEDGEYYPPTSDWMDELDQFTRLDRRFLCDHPSGAILTEDQKAHSKAIPWLRTLPASESFEYAGEATPRPSSQTDGSPPNYLPSSGSMQSTVGGRSLASGEGVRDGLSVHRDDDVDPECHRSDSQAREGYSDGINLPVSHSDSSDVGVIKRLERLALKPNTWIISKKARPSPSGGSSDGGGSDSSVQNSLTPKLPAVHGLDNNRPAPKRPGTIRTIFGNQRPSSPVEADRGSTPSTPRPSRHGFPTMDRDRPVAPHLSVMVDMLAGILPPSPAPAAFTTPDPSQSTRGRIRSSTAPHSAAREETP